MNESHSVVSKSLQGHRLYSPWNSPGQKNAVGTHSLLQQIFPTQGLNPGLPHWKQILYQLSHQGSPRILGWLAYPFSSGSSPPRNQMGVSRTAGGFLTSWAIREALNDLDKMRQASWKTHTLKLSNRWGDVSENFLNSCLLPLWVALGPQSFLQEFAFT